MNEESYVWITAQREVGEVGSETKGPFESVHVHGETVYVMDPGAHVPREFAKLIGQTWWIREGASGWTELMQWAQAKEADR